MKQTIKQLRSKIIFTLFAMLLFCVSSNAQGPDEWTLISTQNNVSVYYQLNACNDGTVVFLKIVNANPGEKSVSWNLWGGTEMSAYNIAAGAERSGSCASGPFLMELIPAGKTMADLNPTVNIQ
jgi:hypothetical protein